MEVEREADSDSDPLGDALDERDSVADGELDSDKLLDPLRLSVEETE